MYEEPRPLYSQILRELHGTGLDHRRANLDLRNFAVSTSGEMQFTNLARKCYTMSHDPPSLTRLTLGMEVGVSGASEKKAR